MGERQRTRQTAAPPQATAEEGAAPEHQVDPDVVTSLIARVQDLEAHVAGMKQVVANPLETVLQSITPDANDPLTITLKASKADPAKRRAWQGTIAWAQRTQGGTRGPLTDWLEAL